MIQETLKELCLLNGVSGSETEVAGYIAGHAKKYTDDVTIDIMGNVLVFKKGRKTPENKIVLCAHMDEVGVVVIGITDDGYLRFAKSGGFDKRVIPGKALLIGKNKVQGIIGCKAIHLLKEKEREKPVELDDMYIDIGVKNKEEAEKLVSLGDAGAFYEDFRLFGDGYIKTKAIDDRFGCSVLLELIGSDLPVDCTFAFTVQEELGLRGAYTAAYSTQPDIALMVEGTTAADLPSVTGVKKVCKVGAGAVLPFMDSGTIYNKELHGLLTNLADENSIPWQTKTYIAGSTDGAVFHKTRKGIKTAAIAAPVRNLHSPTCVGKISDMEAVQKLIWLFLEKMGE